MIRTDHFDERTSLKFLIQEIPLSEKFHQKRSPGFAYCTWGYYWVCSPTGSRFPLGHLHACPAACRAVFESVEQNPATRLINSLDYTYLLARCTCLLAVCASSSSLFVPNRQNLSGLCLGWWTDHRGETVYQLSGPVGTVFTSGWTHRDYDLHSSSSASV